MRYCPKCRSEYQDWVKVCIDCGTELTDQLPPAPTSQKKANKLNPDGGRLNNPGQTRAEKLVTVAAYSYAEEAHINQAKLTSEDIWSFVADDSLVGANQFYSIALNGVKLQVRESDAEQALRILNQGQVKVPESTESIEDRCPQCNSEEIRYEDFTLRWVFLSILLLGFPLLFIKRKWKCKSCGYEWKRW